MEVQKIDLHFVSLEINDWHLRWFASDQLQRFEVRRKLQRDRLAIGSRVSGCEQAAGCHLYSLRNCK